MEDSVTSIWASLNSWFTSTVLFLLLNLMIATILFTSNLPTTNNNNQQQEQEEQHQKQNTPNNNNHRNHPKFARSPSILHRLKSFNFYPQRPEQEFSSETHYNSQALEVTATQYVFNQPLHYQHFDSDSDQVADAPHLSQKNYGEYVGDALRPSDLETGEQQQPMETVMNHFDSDPTHQEIVRDTDSEDAHEEQSDKFQSLDEVYSWLKVKGGHDRTQSDGAIPRKPPAKMKKSASLKVGFSHSEEEIVEARRPATMRERKLAGRVTEDDDVEVDAKADDFINKFKNDLMLQRIESIAGRNK